MPLCPREWSARWALRDVHRQDAIDSSPSSTSISSAMYGSSVSSSPVARAMSVRAWSMSSLMRGSCVRSCAGNPASTGRVRPAGRDVPPPSAGIRIARLPNACRTYRATRRRGAFGVPCLLVGGSLPSTRSNRSAMACRYLRASSASWRARSEVPLPSCCRLPPSCRSCVL